MRIFFFFIAIIFSTTSFLSQEVKVKILGQISYGQWADKKIYILTFNNTLATQDYSTKNHKDLFLKDLDAENIPYKISEKFGMNEIPNIRENYILEISAKTDTKKLEDLIRKHSVSIMKNYFQFDDNFEQQDDKAVLAVKNAIEKAKNISKILGLKTLNIISIDDDSNQILLSSLLDSSGLPDDKKEDFLDFLNKLNEFENNSASQIYRNGGYSIWITFSLK